MTLDYTGPQPAGVIFVDFDGCISICNWRDSVLPRNGLTNSYDLFHELIPMDPPNHWMIKMMEIFHLENYKVVILTGRTESYRKESSNWLAAHYVVYDELVMRPDGDNRPSEEYKLEHVRQYEKDFVKMIYDDRTKVVDAFDKAGYPTFLVRATV